MMESARSPFRRGTQMARVVTLTPVLHHGAGAKAEVNASWRQMAFRGHDI